MRLPRRYYKVDRLWGQSEVCDESVIAFSVGSEGQLNLLNSDYVIVICYAPETWSKISVITED